MKILAAVDRSRFADPVVDMTRRIAGSEPSQILLINVAPREPDLLGQQLRRKVITEAVPEELRDRRELLDRLQGVLRSSGLDCETLLIRGEPAATIQQEARHWGADLIVIGSHGRGFLQRKFLGSVSEALMQGGDTRALIVFDPPPKARAKPKPKPKPKTKA